MGETVITEYNPAKSVEHPLYSLDENICCTYGVPLVCKKIG
nr:MAG TPA: hypothetical protein [Caudoviricetes sp.]DAO56699.1 MAG TPA: hypothetical protein [Caudoviricetes sp.]